jgi:hypothetical protein
MQTRSMWSTLLVLAMAGASLAGCGKSNPTSSTGIPGGGGSAVDQAAVSGTLASTTPTFDDGLMETDDEASFTSSGPAGAMALIHPVRYWRHITDVRRTFEFAFSDTDSTGRPTQADVHVRKYLAGQFVVEFVNQPEDSSAFDSLGRVRKPLHDLWERNVRLVRVNGKTASGDEWKVAAVSGAKCTSYDPATSTDGSLAFGQTRVVSLHVQTAGLDTTVTDPLQFFYLRRIFAFTPGQNITLTATTLRNDDVVVLVRTGQRMRFTGNGDNTYTLNWTTSAEDGVHHFGVNAIARTALFDDQAAYDSQAWLFLYRVVPSVVADLMP